MALPEYSSQFSLLEFQAGNQLPRMNGAELVACKLALDMVIRTFIFYCMAIA